MSAHATTARFALFVGCVLWAIAAVYWVGYLTIGATSYLPAAVTSAVGTVSYAFGWGVW